LLAWFLLPAILLWNVLARASGQGQPPALRRASLDVVYSSSLMRSVSRNDAIAAIRAWVDSVGRGRGFLLSGNVSIIDDLSEIKKRVQQGTADLVVLDPLEYFELEGLGLLEPAFVGVRGKGDVRVQFLLVARQAGGVTAIRDHRGASLEVQTYSRADLGRKWIEVLLHENGLGPADRFFSSVTSVSKPSAAVLPVFFGKAGAGVVDRISFELMREMNPQLGSQLRVVDTSPALVDGILCIHKQYAEFREELREALWDLHKDPAGRQILLVFKSDELRPVDIQSLERVRDLWTKYRRISETPATPRMAMPSPTGQAGAVRVPLGVKP
jgi:phosphonate transport system substrate-binding protein